MDETVRPFLKWAGGKRQLLSTISRYYPKTYKHYFEPFVGAGAVFLHLRPADATIADINPELINAYRVVSTDVEALIADLRKHVNDKEYYYQLRDIDRRPEFSRLTPIERASRFIYLNKTCYNGLFRVNRKGHFNVPFGCYKKPRIVNETNLRTVHGYLQAMQVTILQADFEDVLVDATKGDFVYLDPPYDPVSTTSTFTSYASHGFGRHEQERLRRVFEQLTERGCKVLLSNSSTDFVRNLYGEYVMHPLYANRQINSASNKRGKIEELLIMNYTN